MLSSTCSLAASFERLATASSNAKRAAERQPFLGEKQSLLMNKLLFYKKLLRVVKNLSKPWNLLAAALFTLS
jgi:hypothetical protein